MYRRHSAQGKLMEQKEGSGPVPIPLLVIGITVAVLD
jgi:hypothetical protein